MMWVAGTVPWTLQGSGSVGDYEGGCTVFGSLLQQGPIPGLLFHSVGYHLTRPHGEKQAMLQS